ncbi:hypothetical protein SASPL_108056 [Salvia splendens]|uniref:Uncharacterized protein n=1 Tax=Salvia splendens TaxID=180675 RepID=A0A8X8YG05_SALSN|nr:hypothetical protein SASPL_108056 [Salvia splendens]
MLPTVMNQPNSVDPTAPPPQPLRSSFSCDRHPAENFTGFCPICLCERLTTIDGNSSANTPLLLPPPLLRRHQSPLLLLLRRCETRCHQQQQLLPASEALEDLLFPRALPHKVILGVQERSFEPILRAPEEILRC